MNSKFCYLLSNASLKLCSMLESLKTGKAHVAPKGLQKSPISGAAPTHTQGSRPRCAGGMVLHITPVHCQGALLFTVCEAPLSKLILEFIKNNTCFQHINTVY